MFDIQRHTVNFQSGDVLIFKRGCRHSIWHSITDVIDTEEGSCPENLKNLLNHFRWSLNLMVNAPEPAAAEAEMVEAAEPEAAEPEAAGPAAEPAEAEAAQTPAPSCPSPCH